MRYRSFGWIALLFAAALTLPVYARAAVPGKPKAASFLSVPVVRTPFVAQRFAVSGIVRMALHLNGAGGVVGYEVIDSPADDLTQAVIAVLPAIRAKVPPGVDKFTALWDVKFENGSGEYAFAVGDRRILNLSEMNPALPPLPNPRWADVRVLIDREGNVADVYLARSSPVEFGGVAKDLAKTLHFAPRSSTDRPKDPGAKSMNALRITVDESNRVKVVHVAPLGSP